MYVKPDGYKVHMSKETYVHIPNLTARLTLIGVPWRPCPNWQRVLDGAGRYGILGLLTHEAYSLMTHGVPTNKLPLLLGIHPKPDKMVGSILNGDTEEVKPIQCCKMMDTRDMFDKAAERKPHEPVTPHPRGCP